MTSSKHVLSKALWLAVAALVAFGLYSAGWFWLAGRIRHEADRTVADLNRKGIDAECSNLTVTGYPLRLAVACDSLAYEDDARNVAASSGGMSAVATILGPLTPAVELTGPLRTAVPGMAPLWIDWDRLHASASLSWSLPDLVRVTAEGLSGQTDPQDGDPVSLFSAGQAEVELLQNGKDVDGSGNFKDVEIDPGAIGGRVLPAFDAHGDATLKDGVALLRTGARSLRGRAVTIRTLEVSAGEAIVTLSGPLSVDADGLIDARLDIRITNPKAVAAVLADAIPEQRKQIEQGFAALAMLGSQPTMPLVIVKGRASLGFIPLGKIGAVNGEW